MVREGTGMGELGDLGFSSFIPKPQNNAECFDLFVSVLCCFVSRLTSASDDLSVVQPSDFNIHSLQL